MNKENVTQLLTLFKRFMVTQMGIPKTVEEKDVDRFLERHNKFRSGVKTSLDETQKTESVKGKQTQYFDNLREELEQFNEDKLLHFLNKLGDKGVLSKYLDEIYSLLNNENLDKDMKDEAILERFSDWLDGKVRLVLSQRFEKEKDWLHDYEEVKVEYITSLIEILDQEESQKVVTFHIEQAGLVKDLRLARKDLGLESLSPFNSYQNYLSFMKVVREELLNRRGISYVPSVYRNLMTQVKQLMGKDLVFYFDTNREKLILKVEKDWNVNYTRFVMEQFCNLWNMEEDTRDDLRLNIHFEELEDKGEFIKENNHLMVSNINYVKSVQKPQGYICDNDLNEEELYHSKSTNKVLETRLNKGSLLDLLARYDETQQELDKYIDQWLKEVKVNREDWKTLIKKGNVEKLYYKVYNELSLPLNKSKEQQLQDMKSIEEKEVIKGSGDFNYFLGVNEVVFENEFKINPKLFPFSYFEQDLATGKGELYFKYKDNLLKLIGKFNLVK